MSSWKTILVTGGTGGQGGSVARYLLNDGKFAVRCLTRNPDSEKAKALKKAGAEIIKGELGNPDALKKSLNGIYGVFGVTNFWEHFEKEFQLGKNLIDAVASSDIKHFVFSTLPNIKKITNDELSVPHFDIKGKLEEYSNKFGLPLTFIHLSFYYENFIAFFPPQIQSDGSFIIGFPQGDTPLAGVSVDDTGSIVTEIFNNPDKYIGQTIKLVGDYLPVTKYAEIMSRVLNKKIDYKHISKNVYASMGFPAAEELANMFDFYRRFVLDQQIEIQLCRSINPNMKTFETWIEENKKKFVFQQQESRVD